MPKYSIEEKKQMEKYLKTLPKGTEVKFEKKDGEITAEVTQPSKQTSTQQTYQEPTQSKIPSSSDVVVGTTKVGSRVYEVYKSPSGETFLGKSVKGEPTLTTTKTTQQTPKKQTLKEQFQQTIKESQERKRIQMEGTYTAAPTPEKPLYAKTGKLGETIHQFLKPKYDYPDQYRYDSSLIGIPAAIEFVKGIPRGILTIPESISGIPYTVTHPKESLEQLRASFKYSLPQFTGEIVGQSLFSKGLSKGVARFTQKLTKPYLVDFSVVSGTEKGFLKLGETTAKTSGKYIIQTIEKTKGRDILRSVGKKLGVEIPYKTRQYYTTVSGFTTGDQTIGFGYTRIIGQELKSGSLTIKPKGQTFESVFFSDYEGVNLGKRFYVQSTGVGLDTGTLNKLFAAAEKTKGSEIFKMSYPKGEMIKYSRESIGIGASAKKTSISFGDITGEFHKIYSSSKDPRTIYSGGTTTLLESKTPALTITGLEVAKQLISDQKYTQPSTSVSLKLSIPKVSSYQRTESDFFNTGEFDIQPSISTQQTLTTQKLISSTDRQRGGFGLLSTPSPLKFRTLERTYYKTPTLLTTNTATKQIQITLPKLKNIQTTITKQTIIPKITYSGFSYTSFFNIKPITYSRRLYIQRPMRKITKRTSIKRRFDVNPLADWLSITQTEAATFKKARHPAPTKKIKRMFRTQVIEGGSLRFPTTRMMRGFKIRIKKMKLI